MDEHLDKHWGDSHQISPPPTSSISRGISIQKTATVGGPVTCVSLVASNENICCYAQGSFLERIRLDTNQEQLPQQQQQQQDRILAFDDGTILHGIRHCLSEKQKQYTAVFGGRQVAILQHVLPITDDDDNNTCSMKRVPLRVVASEGGNDDQELNQKSNSNTISFSDWIWDIQWLFPCNHNRCNDKLPPKFDLLIGFAHNVVEQWTFSISNESGSLLKARKTNRWVGSKRCLLYCLDFQVHANEAKVAVGTAMQDIRIWTIPPVTNDEQTSTSSVHINNTAVKEDACLLGHQGVIHGVKWVPDQSEAKSTLQLVSASDDRSIRLWRKNPEVSHPTHWQCLWVGWGHTARIWGLAILVPPHPNLDDFVVVSSGEDSTVRLWNGKTGATLETLRGHSCQCIWSVDANHQHGTIVSGANDGTVSFYGINDDLLIDALSATVNNPPTSNQHLLIPVPDDRPKIQHETTISGTANDDEDNNNEDAKPRAKKKKKKKQDTGQVLVGMKFYTRDSLVVATRSGSLFAVDTRLASGDTCWKFLGLWAQPNNPQENENDGGVNSSTGCTMACCLVNDGNKNGEKILKVAVGTTQGTIVTLTIPTNAISAAPSVPTDTFLDVSRLVDKTLYSSVIQNRIVLNAPPQYRAVQRLAWYLDNDNKAPTGTPGLLSFHVNTVLWWSFTGNESASLSPLWAFDLGTQAIPICFSYDNFYQRLYVGDTRGNLTMFHINNAQAKEESFKPAVTLTRLHQKEHVTDVVVVSASIDGLPKKRTILTVGNDGCVHESYFDSVTGSLIRGFSVNASSSLTGISQIAVTLPSSTVRQEGDVIVSGYFGNTFVLLNVTRGYELFRADTGGRQRQHAFHSSVMLRQRVNVGNEDSNLGSLAVCSHQKDKGRNQILLYNERKARADVLRSKRTYATGVGLHGESIYSASFFTYTTNSGEQCQALLTGSEDCTSKISLYHKGTLISSRQLPAQESCVRTVCSSGSHPDDSSTTSTLLAVGGGKLTLQFFSVTSEKPLAGNRKEGELESHSHPTNSDLQIYFLGYGKTNTKATIDHRINAVKAIRLDNNAGDQEAPLHLVAAGDSEGNCYIYKVSLDVSERKHSWLGLPLPRDDLPSKPILSTALLKIRERVLLLTGTTGGDIGIWDLPGTANAKEWDSLLPKSNESKDDGLFPVRKIASYRAHQMGVNSISAALIVVDSSERVVRVCSGGDDQAISVCDLLIIFDEEDQNGALNSAKVLNLTTAREATSSAVKGVQMLGSDRIISVGYSQRLALWKVSSNGNLVLERTAPVSVGDVNCLACSNPGDHDKGFVVGVGGAGIDLLSIEA